MELIIFIIWMALLLATIILTIIVVWEDVAEIIDMILEATFWEAIKTIKTEFANL